MRGRYLIRNPRKAQAMALWDAALALLPGRTPAPPADPKRILVSNWGHLGDVMTTFGAIQALRRRYPDARIDMIVGSWGKPAINATGLVDTLHIVDHWAVNRSAKPVQEKRARYRRTRADALQAIKAMNYDVAIDFYPFFPPAHPLFRAGGVPVRIGFDSGGFGPLLTHPRQWHDESKPMAELYRPLLTMLDTCFMDGGYDFRPSRGRASLAPLPDALRGEPPYVVVHPGAGAAYKDWGLAHWSELVTRLSALRPDLQIVLTGAGAGEMAMTGALKQDHPSVIDMAGQVDWEGFVSIVAYAALVICPDTATGHVAALYDTPVVSIFTGTNDAVQWGPYAPQVDILTQPVACSPCHRAGCDAMACIRNVAPPAVADAAIGLLNTNPVRTPTEPMSDDAMSATPSKHDGSLG